MKTQRRHDLETNTLARELARWIDRIKPYSKAVTGILVAVMVVFATVWFLSQQTSQTEAAAWDAYYLATEGGRPNLEELAKLADEHGGTSVEQWAELARADSQLQIGTRLLFRDKNEATNFLNQAIAQYQHLQDTVGSEMLRQRATFNLARAYEALGRLEDAIGAYREVDGTFRQMATERLEVLQQKSSKEFYDWFVQAKLPEPGVAGNAPGIPGQGPPFTLEGPGNTAQPRTEKTPSDRSRSPKTGPSGDDAPTGDDKAPAGR